MVVLKFINQNISIQINLTLHEVITKASIIVYPKFNFTLILSQVE